jgi:mRNA interferase HigB
MRIISKAPLKEFGAKYPPIKQAIDAWVYEVEQADWTTPADIKKRYPSADILPNNRVVFNIKGNHYRLIVKIHYNTKIVYIRFIGTHTEYDRIDAETI